MNILQVINDRKIQFFSTLISMLILSLSPAFAQISTNKDQAGTSKNIADSTIIEGIDFGDNSSRWADDGECDDPRFVGIGTAVDLASEDLLRDAQDCSTLFLAGEITLKPNPADIVGDINFGNNSSQWADNDICDDPRFGGTGTDELLLDEDLGRDASDCKQLFLSGQVIYLGDDPNMEIIDFDGILFGDNTSQWANDEECDDPRFRGTGMASELVNDDLEHDATDCLTLYQAGSISLVEDTATTATAAIDFGDDSSRWANDEECDDPRFAGEGIASMLLEEDLGRDASDCRTLYEAGEIYLSTDYSPENSATSPDISAIDFGVDDNQYANDGECDDPRFSGPGTANILLDENLARDASDCALLFTNGEIYLAADTNSEPAPGDAFYGNNSSRWSNDAECDDPRFIGDGMAAQLSASDMGRDAADCKSLLDAGEIELITATNLDFGNDDSEWPNDGECDDPRFAGPGTAVKLDPKNFGRDASDCQMLLQSGQIEFIGGVLAIIDPASVEFEINSATETVTQPSEVETSEGEIVWGDDSSRWANDGECDDPRFGGPGSAQDMNADDRGRDATDCRTLFEAGQIELSDNSSGIKALHATNFDFGDNSSDYADNGICDDPRFGGPGTDPVLLAEDIGRDATDCRSLFESASVSLVSDILLNFGDDTSQWANDDECDDPRFGGKGVAAELVAEDLFKDATDCRTAFERGKIFLVADGVIDFGDNSSEWANDEECDDLRFAGPGAAGGSAEEDLLKDASDCRTLYRNSQIYLLPADVELPALAFGDNSSQWASDGECDDPRFFGPGSAAQLIMDDLGHDAIDCRYLFEIGQIELGQPLSDMSEPNENEESASVIPSDIDFGDDSSSWSNDEECDDPRFAGPGVASILLDEDMGRDATDCRTLFEAGQITFNGDQGASSTPAAEISLSGIDFGNNESDFADNNICDDPRFVGEGVDGILLDEDLGRDAADCSTLFAAGKIQLAQNADAGGQDISPATEAPVSEVPTSEEPATEINFGDDTSLWANDGECDDPRFTGPGTAPAPLNALDMLKDASDCQSLFEQGEITLI